MNPSRDLIGKTVTFMRASAVLSGDMIMVTDFHGPDFSIKVSGTERVGDDIIITGRRINTVDGASVFESTQSAGSAIAVIISNS
jgi:hypothetical protein